MRSAGWSCAGLVLVLAAAPECAVGQPQPGSKPNILVIVDDDMGYADVGASGCTDIPTPAGKSVPHRGGEISIRRGPDGEYSGHLRGHGFEPDQSLARGPSRRPAMGKLLPSDLRQTTRGALRAGQRSRSDQQRCRRPSIRENTQGAQRPVDA